MIYKKLIRPLLFKMDPEVVHGRMLVLGALAQNAVVDAFLKSFFTFENPCLRSRLFGTDFLNPVGLAAGFDKDCSAPDLIFALGFGFAEIAAVTPEPQPGNPKPRIFRLPIDQALINRMGFPSLGADVVAERLRQFLVRRRLGICGINLGKAKDTPLERALDDYLASFRKLKELADYFVVNVSSPNTPELRKLQEPARLSELLSGLQSENKGEKPLLVKITSDLSLQEIDQLLPVLINNKVNGIVAVNTTTSRAGIATKIDEAGGLSGTPLYERALKTVRHIYKQTSGELPIVGCGGIFTAADAWNMFKAGASLVQIYTALVYEGPMLVKKIKQGLAQNLRQRGLTSITEAIGTDATKS